MRTLILLVASATALVTPTPRRQVALTPVRAAAVIDSDETKIEAARKFLLEGNGLYAPPRPELLAEDFVFRAPVVGPLCKTDYGQSSPPRSLSTCARRS